MDRLAHSSSIEVNRCGGKTTKERRQRHADIIDTHIKLDRRASQILISKMQEEGTNVSVAVGHCVRASEHGMSRWHLMEFDKNLAAIRNLAIEVRSVHNINIEAAMRRIEAHVYQLAGTRGTNLLNAG